VAGVEAVRAVERVKRAFRSRFKEAPRFVVRAPGRVNLIGEHTDYNDGFVLPIAIEHSVWIALRPRTDRRVHVHSLEMEQSADFELDSLVKEDGWAEYVKGVAHELIAAGKSISGWEGVMSGDVPRGAGLSSSAAVELATARAFAACSGFAWEPLEMARLARRAENHWVGVACGIMDQMTSALATAGHALFLDCRTLEYEHIPWPAMISAVVLDSSTRRGLRETAYNRRKAECAEAARSLRVRALRDVSVQEFEEVGRKLPDPIRKRARHVISENARVLSALHAMQAEDRVGLGILLNQSHRSLKEDFEVTNQALDWIVEAAQAESACYGARMTGAGFGGCAVALVQADQAETFSRAVTARYRRISGLTPQLYVCRPNEGASLA